MERDEINLRFAEKEQEADLKLKEEKVLQEKEKTEMMRAKKNYWGLKTAINKHMIQKKINEERRELQERIEKQKQQTAPESSQKVEEQEEIKLTEDDNEIDDEEKTQVVGK